MKRVKFGLLLCFHLWLALIFYPASAQYSFYVSPSGSDNNPGTLSLPFLTLNKARLAVRTVNKSMTDNIYVYLRDGLYQTDSTISFDDGDSGFNGFDVVYRAYNGELPIISGGKPITGWTLVTGNLWKAHVSGMSQKIRQLYINGKRANMANGPTLLAKGGYGMYKGLPTGFYVDSLCNIAKNLNDIEVNINKQYVNFYLGVDTILKIGSHKVVMMQEPFFSYAQRLPWQLLDFDSIGTGVFLEKATFSNAFEFLGSAGEFYYDRGDSTLYYTPRQGEVMGTAEVIVPVLQTLISVKGSSLSQKATHIVFTGLHFEYTQYSLPRIGNSTAFFAGQANCPFVNMSDVQPWCLFGSNQFGEIKLPPAGIQVDNSTHIRFLQNTIRHMGSLGIDLRNGVTNSLICGNLIEDIGSSGINIGSPQHAFDGDGVREAETGIVGGGASVIADSNASGGQSIGGLTQIGSNVSFINVKRYLHSGQQACMMNYACTDFSTLSLYINDKFIKHIHFYPSGGSNNYTETSSDIGDPGLIKNFNFELGDSAWNKSGSNAIISKDPSNALTGNFYAKIVGNGFVNQMVTSGFKPGDYFDLEGRGKLSCSGAHFTTLSEGAVIGIKCWSKGYSSLLANAKLTFNTSTDYYRFQTLRFKVPNNTEVLEIYIYNGNSSASFQADELALRDAGDGKDGEYKSGPGYAPQDTVRETVKLQRDVTDIGGPILIDYIGSGEFTYLNEEICQQDTVANNYFRLNSYFSLGSPVINAYFVKGVNINHNDIDHTPYTGISVGWGWTSPLTPLSSHNNISYNSIQNVMENDFDGGGIYTNGQQPGSTLSNNFINVDNSQYGAIYCDNGSQGLNVTNNVVENVANNVPFLRLNYWAYFNNADSNYAQSGVNNTAFIYDTVHSSIRHTFTYTSGSRPTAAQAIVDSAGLQPLFKSIVVPSSPYIKFLKNPGFETSSNYWNNLGNASIKSGTGNNNSYGAVITAMGGYTQVINSGFTAGYTYTISGYGKMSNTSGKGYIGVKCRDASGHVLLEQHVTIADTFYIQKSTTFIVPPSTAYIEAFVWNCNRNAVFSTDDIQFTNLIQLVTNFDFENGETAWKSLGHAIIRNHSPNAHSGRYEVFTSGKGGYQQIINSGFVAGGKYTISGFGKMTCTPGTGKGKGHIGIKCRSFSNKLLLQEDMGFINEASYTQKTATFTIPFGTGYLEVYVWNESSMATFVADDIVLTGENISNPSFEYVDNDWTNLGNASIQKNPHNAHSGNYEIVTTGIGGYNQYINSGFIIGKKYTISGYGKMTGKPGAGKGKGHIGIKCWDTSKNLLLQQDLLFDKQTIYTQQSANFIVPTGTSCIEVYVWNDTSDATIIADDISLQ